MVKRGERIGRTQKQSQQETKKQSTRGEGERRLKDASGGVGVVQGVGVEPWREKLWSGKRSGKGRRIRNKKTKATVKEI